jgi:hypothetical protein
MSSVFGIAQVQSKLVHCLAIACKKQSRISTPCMNMSGSNCTLPLDLENLSMNYVMVDACSIQLHEHKPDC